MMEGILEIRGKGPYRLPALLSWSVTLTGGVPCDSFTLTCLYHEEMAALLDRAWRITLRGADRDLLRAVVDEYEICEDARGRRLCLSGRGLAALLLDNESTAVEYSRPTLSELLRNHAAPYGLGWSTFPELSSSAAYAVASGSSQWKAINGFTQYCGGFALRISPSGQLLPVAWKDNGRRLLIGERTPLLSLRWREKRYGVYSEVLVVDKVRRTVQRTENAEFIRRGGCCRRVVYTPGKSTGAAMRYTGAYQLAQSQKESRQLHAVLPGFFFAQTGQVLRMEQGHIGIGGEFVLEEIMFAGGAGGETTTLVMRRL